MDKEKTRRYSSPALAEEIFNAEGGFCLSSQLDDFSENKIYTEDFE